MSRKRMFVYELQMAQVQNCLQTLRHIKKNEKKSESHPRIKYSANRFIWEMTSDMGNDVRES